ncbi:RNA polymerase-associated protein RapA, partial [Pseudomonas aeruginosa]
FLNTCPTANAPQHEFRPRLLPLLDGAEDKAWDALPAEGPARPEAPEAELPSGRDRLLALNSGGAGEGAALVEAIAAPYDDFALPIYMERLFDAYGIHSEDHSENALILKQSEKMLDAGFPLGTEHGVPNTYDPAQALARAD